MSKILIRFARASTMVCMYESPLWQLRRQAQATLTATEPRKQSVTRDAIPATCDGCGCGGVRMCKWDELGSWRRRLDSEGSWKGDYGSGMPPY